MPSALVEMIVVHCVGSGQKMDGTRCSSQNALLMPRGYSTHRTLVGFCVKVTTYSGVFIEGCEREGCS